MPIYGFVCNKCNKEYEILMSYKEHDEQKDKISCQECHSPLKQQVAPLRFTLKGVGWFAAADTSGFNSAGTGYEITQSSLNENLEEEKRAEDRFYTAQAKGEA